MNEKLRIGHTGEQFLDLVNDALHERDDARVKARQDAVRDGTWDARAEWVSDLIESVPPREL